MVRHRRISDLWGIVVRVHLTEGGRRITRAVGRGGRRRLVPAAVATLAVLGSLAGVLAAVLGAPPRSDLSAGAAPSLLNLPVVRPTSGDTPVAPGMTMGTSAHLMALAGSHPPAVAPLRRTLQADLLIVAPHTLPHSVLTAV